MSFKCWILQLMTIMDNYIYAPVKCPIYISEWQLKQGKVAPRVALVTCHVTIFFDKANPDAVVWNLNQTEIYNYM